MNKFYHWITVVCFSTFLAACGGGGGGGSNVVASTATFQLKTAWVNYFTDHAAHTFTVTGTSSGTPYSGSGTLNTSGASAPTTAIFEGITGLSATTSLSGTITGVGTFSGSGTLYTDLSDLPIGSQNSAEHVVVQGTAIIPTTGKVFDTGVIYTAIRYQGTNTLGLVNGTQTMSFSIDADTANTALLRIITVNKNTGSVTTSTETLTFRITPTGALTWVSDNTVTPTVTTNITF